MNLINNAESERMHRKKVAEEKAEKSSIKKFLKDLAKAIIIAISLFGPFYLIYINL